VNHQQALILIERTQADEAAHNAHAFRRFDDPIYGFQLGHGIIPNPEAGVFQVEVRAVFESEPNL
jgi:hypothetical protein